jgi:hypothetical protein
MTLLAMTPLWTNDSQAVYPEMDIQAARPRLPRELVGVPQADLLAGRERAFVEQYVFPSLTAVPHAITDTDVEELARGYARADGWRGAAGLFQSLLQEGPELRKLATSPGLTVPVLAVGAGGRRAARPRGDRACHSRRR